ncbi:MAG: hypothetical protein WC332_09980 [Clostridia bacterium]|jgi:hypothetical protein
MEEERQESSIIVKWWQVVLVLLGIFGFFFVNALAMESRVTKLETLTSVSIANIEKSICEIKETLKENKK